MDGLLEIYECLFAQYGKMNWWPAKTPYEMMVGAILTQNTTWKNVEKALANFEDRLTPEFIEMLALEELAEIIRPSGFFNQKALRLKALTKWYRNYNYSILQASKEDGHILRVGLLDVKGIGHETADSILLYALSKPYFVVDAYTRRILSRYGYSISNDYDGLRSQIESSIPKSVELYNEFHALIVEHAKLYCKIKPQCERCPLSTKCSKDV